MTAKKPVNKSDIMSQLEPLSKVLQKGVGQIWKMFIMRYVAKGLSQLFLAAFIVWMSWYFLHPEHQLWMALPWTVAAVFTYDAIQLLINPWYFAMNDVALRIKSEKLFYTK